MPRMGESVAEATILKWLKKEGDSIEADEPVLEIATDKVDSEVPSPAAGKLSKRMFEEGQVVKVGEVIALISAEGETETDVPRPQAAPVPAKVPEPIRSGNGSPAPAPVLHDTAVRKQGEGRFYSPLVRSIARQEGISFTELDTILGSGMNNRLTKQDLLRHLQSRGTGTPASPSPSPVAEVRQSVKEFTVTTPGNSGNVEIIEMDRMRKLIADHMVMSKHTSPHVTSFVEADVTNMVKWRDKVKKEFEKRENEKITYTPLFIEAICRAIKDFPMVNISVEGNRIIKKNFINIGMATALPSGNLIVPVIRQADYLNLTGLTKTVNDLAARARTNRLKPDEIQDGTFTLTNVGTFGNVMGTPIINQPQVAILATGAIRKKPAVIETPEGDTIGIRHMMFLSLSYDHRVVDGALGGSFLRRIADYLEQFDLNRGF
ncbi:MAG: 2-oxo acid dehydrogenase subunit E2 [Bacteroidia bacterium]|nr:2-oxo acid dehydrogenase subunit E2 [Bacteroidia bacterium]